MKKLFVIFIMIFSVCSCSVEQEQINSTPKTRDIFAMDTYMNLKVYDNNAETVLEKASSRVTELEKLLSLTDENSDIWKVNHADGNKVSVSSDTSGIINTAVNIGYKTDGALDITVYPILKEWGFTTGEYKVPDNNTIENLLKNVDYRKIETGDGYVRIPQDFQLDLGSLAKGYTSDSIIEIFRENGVESAIVNLGGNVHTLGTKPDGSLWKVGIKDPFQPDSEMCIVSVEDKAVITSGSYERYFTGEDGKNYWHIIDSKDGRPADNALVSVTIIGSNGMMCDALSTALFVAGTENAVEYWQNNGDFDMILVTDDGKLLITENIEKNLKVMCSMPVEVIHYEE